jgi:hypothetical protein
MTGNDSLGGGTVMQRSQGKYAKDVWTVVFIFYIATGKRQKAEKRILRPSGSGSEEKVDKHSADEDEVDCPVKKLLYDAVVWLPIRHRKMTAEEYQEWEDKGMYVVCPFPSQ